MVLVTIYAKYVLIFTSNITVKLPKIFLFTILVEFYM